MDFKKTENGLTIYIGGRIDSNSAPIVEKDMVSLRDDNPEGNLIVDAEKLEYISSAGLRVILRMRKSNPDMKIINVSDEVYDIFEMTGFAEIISVERAFKTMSVDGCEVIGRGAKGTVYRFNADTAVKVYKNPDSLPDINRERELARRAFVLGVPTAISYAIVKVGETYGSVFELLNADSFSNLIAKNPGDMDKYVTLFTDLLKIIHSTKVSADEMPDIKILIEKWMRDCAKFLTDAENARIKELVDAVPDVCTMLHCDYHTNNVMMQNGETIIIDMDTLSHGHPIFELANIHIAYVGFGEVKHEMVEKFIGLPYETTCAFWDAFLEKYTDVHDKAKLEEIDNKIKLLSYLRLLRHYSRREGVTEDVVAKCVKLVKDTLPKVDTLLF